MSQPCVDASVALMLLLPDELSWRVQGLWRSWIEAGVELVAPPLFHAEVTSVLREKVYFGHIDSADGEAAFSAFIRLDVRSLAPADLQLRAWDVAREYNRPRAYDAQYIALARSLGCELWTGDRRLANALRASWVRWVGEPPAVATERPD